MPPPPQPASSMRPRDRDAGALQKRDDLGAAVVLEQRVVVLGAEPQVGVRLDGALVNPAHVPSDSARSPAARAAAPDFAKLIDERGPVVAGGGFRDVERHDDGAIRVGLEHVLNNRILSYPT